jgi:hypothetical protein
MNTNGNIQTGSRGSILVFVLVIAVIIGGATFALLQYANAGLLAQRVEKDNAQALANAFNGLEIARNTIDNWKEISPEYIKVGDDYHNPVLWAADSTADGNYGATPIVNNGVSTVTVSYLGYSWYELHSVATVGDVTRILKLRVREKDYYSRYGTLIASQNQITIEDDASYYGSIHANGNIVFEDNIAGRGACLYGLVTSCNKFTFKSGAQAETQFFAGYADNLGKAGNISMPPVRKIYNSKDPTDPDTLKGFTGAWGADGTVIYSDDPDLKKAKVQFRSGPGGYSVVTSAPTDVYIQFINEVGNRKKAKITIKNAGATLYPTGGATGIFDIAQGGTLYQEPVIHVGGSANIAGMKGELDGRVTVCCESSISISADLVYEDDNDQKAMLFDPNDPRNDNYLPNPEYCNYSDAVPSALGMIAVNDILYTGAEDDANLEVNAAMIAMTGDIKCASSIGERGHLRSFGSRCANGKIEPRTSGYGYMLSAVHIYDEEGCLNPAPQFPSLFIPYYTGLEMIR